MPTDPVLFACYILFIYFNGRNVARIEREMRRLGYTHFHRRNLYPRGDTPGWIAKYGWSASVSPTGAEGVPPTTSPKGESPAGDAGALPGNAGALACMSAKHEHEDAPLPDRRSPLPPADQRSPLRDLQFQNWLRTVSPNMTWTWRHQQVILEQLERVTRGECKRLMIFLPPRHGKSELVTVRYTAWRMQRDPSMNVILGSYNQRLADRFSRKIRKVIADAEVGQTFQSVPADYSSPQPDPSNSTHHSQEGRLAPVNASQGVSSPHVSKGPANHEIRISAPNPTASQNSRSAPRDPKPDTRRISSMGEPYCSPFPFASTRPANSVSEWETTAGGGFRSVGVGSGVTGFGASLIIIDDPIKSRAEAESETYRERVWDWFTDDLYTRLEPDGAIVLIQTRWHEDDLAGRLLRESAEEGGEHWDVVNLPALSELPALAGGLAKPNYKDQTLELRQDAFGNPPLTSGGSDWRTEPDTPLCPERFDLAALKRIRRRLGEYSFAALYQQRPTPAEGGLFKREWFKKIIPFAPPGLKWKRAYDLAVSTKTSADYTASFRCAFDGEGNLYIAGGLRARLEYPEQRRLIIDRVKNEPDTEHGIELALHGQALLQDLRREPGIRGYLLKGIRAESDKYTRALAWAPLAEEGKVILVRNSGTASPHASANPRVSSPHVSKDPLDPSVGQPSDLTPATTFPQSAVRSPHSWIPDFLDEVCSFPSAAHDDQVDAVSLAVQMLKRPRRGGYAF